MADPATLPRRSFVYRRLVALGMEFDQAGGPMRRGDGTAQAVGALALCDLSLAPRTGFKGAGALDWLKRQGVGVPDEDNRALRGGDALVARLAPGEAMILGDAALVERLAAACETESPPGCYLVPRADSHAWFRLVGAHSPALFAKLCGVDLRERRFADLAIAQTFVARLPAIVMRDDIGPTPAYHLLADSAGALYLWDCVVDAMMEFDGAVVGTEGLEHVR